MLLEKLPFFGLTFSVFAWKLLYVLLMFVTWHYFAEVYPAIKDDGKSNWKTFRHVTRIVCSCLSQIGDYRLVLKMLEKIIVDQIVCSLSWCMLNIFFELLQKYHISLFFIISMYISSLISKINFLYLINIYQCSDLPLDNKCAFVRLLLTLDSKPSRLLDQSIVSISHALPQYMINVLSVSTAAIS